MRVGVNASILLCKPPTGLFQHVRSLAGELANLVSRPQCFILERRHEPTSTADLNAIQNLIPGCEVRIARPPARFYRLWKRFAAFNKVDVLLHNPGSQIPASSRAANVYVVPDIIPLVINYGDPSFESESRKYYEAAATSGDEVIVWSNHTRQDFLSRVGGTADRVHVVPLAAGPEFRRASAEAVSAVRQRYQLGQAPYILCTSSIEIRKNHATLVRAFGRLIARNPTLPHQLVFSGGKWIGAEAVFELVQQLGLSTRLKYLGYADDLTALYSGADLFVFPSLYEGFGLPPLEAMACGTPVLAANATSLPEVVGDAGLLFEPTDDQQLAALLEQVLTDRALHEKLARASLERAAKYTWRRTAEGYLEVFQTAVSRKQARATKARD